jgi:hypothetical protein
MYDPIPWGQIVLIFVIIGIGIYFSKDNNKGDKF